MVLVQTNGQWVYFTVHNHVWSMAGSTVLIFTVPNVPLYLVYRGKMAFLYCTVREYDHCIQVSTSAIVSINVMSNGEKVVFKSQLTDSKICTY